VCRAAVGSISSTASRWVTGPQAAPCLSLFAGWVQLAFFFPSGMKQTVFQSRLSSRPIFSLPFFPAFRYVRLLSSRATAPPHPARCVAP